MSILSYLYTLIISPLELLFEVIFSIANRITGNAGLSIIFLSLSVSFLVLPLYKHADELQAEERDIQLKMAPWLKHIKKTFKGDERFMMISEYYRINNYKPIYALKSSASLLLQIPFFIAAYNLLSGMQGLRGMQFGPIADLGKEDAMFMIGSFPVNILPILMTLINIVSGIIYTKGHPLKAKIQVYGLALIFLVLLYHSPAGLVFYWLLNNVFSLLKNIFYKLKNPKKVLSIVLTAAGLALLIMTLIRPDLGSRQKILLAIVSILLCLPLVISLIGKDLSKKAGTADKAAFFIGAVLMALITGLLIPSGVINDSSLEFIDVLGLTNPASYIVNSLLLSFGSWVLWGGVFYLFMNDNIKAVMGKAVWIICGVSIVDYMLFGTKLGIMSSVLQYEKKPEFSINEYIVNTIVVIAVAVVFGFIYFKFRKIAKTVLVVGIMTVLYIGVMNIILICLSYSWYQSQVASSSDDPSIPLSTNGQNVIVLMIDRALGTQVPYILKEKPELKEKFDGFTYYSNTVSYGSWTLIGAPALYGGYEYTPEKLNERDQENLVDKHNESLRVMPVLFGQNGYKVTVCDPSYAGYKMVPDLSIYSDHPEFNCYNTNGRFDYFADNSDDGEAIINSIGRLNDIRNRNFYCFSLMKISPLLLQETLYDDGAYNEDSSVSDTSGDIVNTSLTQHLYGLSKSIGYHHDFINAYAVLTNLPKITTVSDSSENTFLMMANDTAHAPCLLQEPDYVPSMNVDNTQYDVDMVSRYTIDGKTMQMTTDKQVIHYHTNMATLLRLGEWFDYLKEQGVYDNTRIIIVSDHGRDLDQFNVFCNDKDMEFFMPILLVKDFNAKGFTTSDEFMTNADTPTLATSGLIENPVNPFTGNPINSKAKEGQQNIFFSDFIDSSEVTGNTFVGSWYTYEGSDPRNPDNWKYVGEH